MKAAPTLDGRIRIDVESVTDLAAMQAIAHDARLTERDLSERLSEGQVSDDWREFVQPDLQQGFGSQIGHIERAVAGLDVHEPRPLFIVKEEAEAWYGGLNQARLALEARYGISGHHPKELSDERRMAWFRSHFYQRLQEMIFEFLMSR